MTTEIDRVSETTKFNETYLLKGDKSLDKQYTYGFKNNTDDIVGAATEAAGSTKLTVKFEGNATAADVTQKVQDEENEFLIALRDSGVKVSANSDGKAVTYSLSLTGSAADKFSVSVTDAGAGTFDIMDKENKKLGTITVGGADDAGVVAATAGSKSDTIVAKDITAARSKQAQAKYYDKDGNAIPANALSKYVTMKSDKSGVTAKGGAPQAYDAVGNKVEIKTDDISHLQDLTAPLTVKLHVGADATSNNQISINIESMSAKGLGINGLKVDGSDDTNALNAIDTIKQSIQKVSDQRSALGAVQNRLEHTISNLDNVVENTTSAESRIRDTDMAEEMVNYSKNNILQQAGQSMLAQANQANQGVLSLLQ